MKLLRFEMKKMIRNRTVLAAVLFLLAVNLIAFYEVERNQSSYDSPTEEYRTLYENFLEQIPLQAEQMKRTEQYQNPDTFRYRNLEKTVQDYARLNAENLTTESQDWLLAYSGYPMEIYFVLTALVIFSGPLVLQEKKRGIFLITKSTGRGHRSLPLSKIEAMALCSLIFAAFTETGTLTLAVSGTYVRELGARIQSLSIFRDCAYPITILQAVLLCAAVRFLTALAMSELLMLLLFLNSKKGVAYLEFSAFIILEFICSRTITPDGSWNYFRVINIFSLTNPEELLGVYCNLNVFGIPVDKLYVALAVFFVTTLCSVSLGCLVFSSKVQILSEGILEKLADRLRKGCAFLWRSSRVSRFEFRKIFWHERRLFLVVLLAIYLITGIREATAPRMFSDFRSAQYHRLLKEIAGPVTEESLSYIEQQRADIERMYEEMEQEEDSDYAQIIYHEIKSQEDGLEAVEEQRDVLLSDGGGYEGKYFIDEESYLREFSNVSDNVLRFLLAAILYVILIGRSESFDEDKGMRGLLRTTRKGLKSVQKERRRILFLSACILFLCLIIPWFLRLWGIDGFSTLGHPLRDFTRISFAGGLTLGEFFLMTLIAKAVFFLGYAAGVTLIAEKVRKSSVVIGIGVLIPVVVCLIFWLFQWNIPMILLYATGALTG